MFSLFYVPHKWSYTHRVSIHVHVGVLHILALYKGKFVFERGVTVGWILINVHRVQWYRCICYVPVLSKQALRFIMLFQVH